MTFTVYRLLFHVLGQMCAHKHVSAEMSSPPYTAETYAVPKHRLWYSVYRSICGLSATNFKPKSGRNRLLLRFDDSSAL